MRSKGTCLTSPLSTNALNVLNCVRNVECLHGARHTRGALLGAWRAVDMQCKEDNCSPPLQPLQDTSYAVHHLSNVTTQPIITTASDSTTHVVSTRQLEAASCEWLECNIQDRIASAHGASTSAPISDDRCHAAKHGATHIRQPSKPGLHSTMHARALDASYLDDPLMQHHPGNLNALPSLDSLQPSCTPSREPGVKLTQHVHHSPKYLTAALKRCSSWTELLDLLQANISILNYIHVSAAITHAAQLYQEKAWSTHFTKSSALAAPPSSSGSSSTGGGSLHIDLGTPASSTPVPALHHTTHGSSQEQPGNSASSPQQPCVPSTTTDEAGLPLALASLLLQLLQQHLSSYTSRQTANTLWALAKLQLQLPPELLEALRSCSTLHLAASNAQELANSMYAWACLDSQPGDAWLSCLCKACPGQWRAFKANELSSMLWSAAKLRLAPEATWLGALLEAQARLLPTSQPQELANSIWALASLGSPPPPTWWAAFLQSLQCSLPYFSPQELANTLWACGKLQLPLPQPLLQQLLEHGVLQLAAGRMARRHAVSLLYAASLPQNAAQLQPSWAITMLHLLLGVESTSSSGVGNGSALSAINHSHPDGSMLSMDTSSRHSTSTSGAEVNNGAASGRNGGSSSSSSQYAALLEDAVSNDQSCASSPSSSSTIAAAAAAPMPNLSLPASSWDARDVSDIFFSAGQLRLQLPPAVAAALLQLAHASMDGFTQQGLSLFVCSAARLRLQLPNTILASWQRASYAVRCQLKPCEVAAVLVALGRMRVRPGRKWLNDLLAEVHRQADSYRTDELIQVALGLGLLRYSPSEEWVEWLLAELDMRVGPASAPRQLAMALYALALLAPKSSEVILWAQDLANNALPLHLPHLAPRELSCIAWAVARLGRRAPPSDPSSNTASAGAAAAAAGAAGAMGSTGQQQAAGLGLTVDGVRQLDAGSSDARQQLGSLQSQNLAMSGVASGRGMQATASGSSRTALQLSPECASALLVASHKQLAHFDHQQLSMLVWACQLMGLVPDQAWCDEFFRVGTMHLRQGRLTTLDIALHIWSVGRMGLTPSAEWSTAFLAEAAMHIGCMNPRMMLGILAGVSGLETDPPDGWLVNFVTGGSHVLALMGAKQRSLAYAAAASIDPGTAAVWGFNFQELLALRRETGPLNGHAPTTESGRVHAVHL